MTTRKPFPQTIRAVAYIYFWCHPTSNAGQILEDWKTHPVLRDYRAPDRQVLTVWVEEFVAERNRALY
jgi:NADH:ubiquinone oxidoreductase subunit C